MSFVPRPDVLVGIWNVSVAHWYDIIMQARQSDLFYKPCQVRSPKSTDLLTLSERQPATPATILLGTAVDSGARDSLLSRRKLVRCELTLLRFVGHLSEVSARAR